MRVHLKGDSKAGEFADLLLKIGDDHLDEANGKIDIPENMCTTVKTVDRLICEIYPDIRFLNDKSVA
jgi:hypothetical protein